MIIIQHRVNKLEDYKKVPFPHGIEVDVRYHKNNLILNHDPFDHHTQENIKLSDLLKKWSNKGPLVLNLKSEGIEDVCIEAMRTYKIKNWFFLDMKMPYFVIYDEKAFNSSGIFSIIKFIYYEKLYFLSNLLKNFKLKVVKIK